MRFVFLTYGADGERHAATDAARLVGQSAQLRGVVRLTDDGLLESDWLAARVVEAQLVDDGEGIKLTVETVGPPPT